MKKRTNVLLILLGVLFLFLIVVNRSYADKTWKKNSVNLFVGYATNDNKKCTYSRSGWVTVLEEALAACNLTRGKVIFYRNSAELGNVDPIFFEEKFLLENLDDNQAAISLNLITRRITNYNPSICSNSIYIEAYLRTGKHIIRSEGSLYSNTYTTNYSTNNVKRMEAEIKQYVRSVCKSE